MARSEASVPLRQAIASALAALVLFVGIIHEVVGSALYPEGPAKFGGLLWWHAAGVLLTIVGGLLFFGTLRLIRLPVRSLAIGICLIGLLIAVAEAVQASRFHLFAVTMFLSGAGIATLHRGGRSSAWTDQ